MIPHGVNFVEFEFNLDPKIVTVDSSRRPSRARRVRVRAPRARGARNLDGILGHSVVNFSPRILLLVLKVNN